jgi:hypothetical protein
MSKPHLAVLAAVVLFLRWLVTGHVAVTAGGLTFIVPALALAAVTVLTLTAAAVTLLVYRTRAEQAMLAAWQARKAATS